MKTMSSSVHQLLAYLVSIREWNLSVCYRKCVPKIEDDTLRRLINALRRHLVGVDGNMLLWLSKPVKIRRKAVSFLYVLSSFKPDPAQ